MSYDRTTLHYSKCVLSCFADVVQSTPFQLYRLYLEHVMVNEEDLNTVLHIPMAYFEHYYGPQPLQAPKVFSANVPECLLKLGQLTHRRVAIFDVSPATGKWSRVFDYRFYASGTPLFYIILHDKNVHVEHHYQGPPPRIMESRYMSLRSEPIHTCYFRALCRLLALDDPPSSLPPLPQFYQLMSCSDAYVQFLQQPLLCVTHVSERNKPMFKYLGLLASSQWPKETSLRHAMVVCFTMDHTVYVLKSPWADLLRQSRLHLFGQATGDGRHPIFEPEPQAATAEKRGLCGTPHCRACQGAEALKPRLPHGKLDRLYKTSLSSFDFLTLFKLYTPDHERLILRVHELSYGSYDIESMAVPIHPSPVAALHSRNEALLQSGAHHLYNQVPAFIGFMDTLSATPAIVERDETQPWPEQHLLDQFLTLLMERVERCRHEKKTLLQPLRTHLEGYHQAHQAFYQDDPKLGRQCWKATPMGHFEAHLHYLETCFYVNGYNASNYDLCLMYPLLSCSIKQRFPKTQIKIKKAGHSVVELRFDHVTFVDTMRLGPSKCSLKNFAKMLNVTDVSKGIFPFQRFQTMDDLLAPELPAEAAQWESSLATHQISQEEVNEARQTFQDLKCRHVKDYLLHYLGSDVKLLQTCLTQLFSSYFQLLHLLPYDVKCKSISSFSFYAGLHFLMKQKRVGFFQTTNPVVYQLLTLSMRGGICQMLRGAAGSDDLLQPYEQFAATHMGLDPTRLKGCNSHLGVAGETPRLNQSIDKNSLYPHTISTYRSTPSRLPGSGEAGTWQAVTGRGGARAGGLTEVVTFFFLLFQTKASTMDVAFIWSIPRVTTGSPPPIPRKTRLYAPLKMGWIPKNPSTSSIKPMSSIRKPPMRFPTSRQGRGNFFSEAAILDAKWM